VSYAIEKLVRGEWVPAFGLNSRSYVRASTDVEAVREFYAATVKVRAPYRLAKRTSWGMSVSVSVLATAGRPAKEG
jgi:hypothetical protein